MARTLTPDTPPGEQEDVQPPAADAADAATVKPALTPDLLGEAEEVPEEEFDSQIPAAKSRDRDAAQQVIDGQVKGLHDKYVAKGKPAPEKAPRARRTIAPEFAAELKRMIRRAESLHKVHVHFFKPAIVTDENGKTVIVYAVTDKPEVSQESSAS